MISQDQPERGRQKDVQDLAAMAAAGLTLYIMAFAWEGYFEAVLRFFQARFADEIAYVATFGTYVLGAGIAYKLFKIFFGALFMKALIDVGRGQSPLSTLGF